MNEIGFVVPLEAEASIIVDKLKNKTRKKSGIREIIAGTLWGKKVSLVVSGCGKIKAASATQLLIDKAPAKFYIHYGTSGALSPTLEIGDVVLAHEVVEHDVVELFPYVVAPPIHRIKIPDELLQSTLHTTGRIISGDKDIVEASIRDELLALHDALTVDWESAGFALTCELNGVTGLIFRAVSDKAYEHTSTEYGANQRFAIERVYTVIKELFA